MSEKSFATYEKEGWDRNAADYDEFTLPFTAQAFRPLLDSLGRLDNLELLEVASGTGQLAKQAAALGAIVTGLDVAPNMVAVARQACPSAKFEVGDAEALPFDDDSFDAVLCCFGLLHMDQPETAIREAARVLRPNGRFSFTVWLGPDKGSEFFGTILGVYQSHANMDVGLPPAPPIFAMADATVHEPHLRNAGFADISATELPIAAPVAGGEAIMDFIDKGSVRTRMLYERQTQDVKRQIRDELIANVERFVREGRHSIPCPAMLVTATLPA